MPCMACGAYGHLGNGFQAERLKSAGCSGGGRTRRRLNNARHKIRRRRAESEGARTNAHPCVFLASPRHVCLHDNIVGMKGTSATISGEGGDGAWSMKPTFFTSGFPRDVYPRKPASALKEHSVFFSREEAGVCNGDAQAVLVRRCCTHVEPELS